MSLSVSRVQLSQAIEEPSGETQMLIQDNNQRGYNQKQRRSRSGALLKKELDTHGKACSREFLYKVVCSGTGLMVVLYKKTAFKIDFIHLF